MLRYDECDYNLPKNEATKMTRKASLKMITTKMSV